MTVDADDGRRIADSLRVVEETLTGWDAPAGADLVRRARRWIVMACADDAVIGHDNGRRCQACGEELPSADPRARYCGPTCRKRAQRARSGHASVTDW